MLGRGRQVMLPEVHTSHTSHPQQTEVTIPGVNKLGIVREKTSSTVKYIPDNTWFFQLTLMAYVAKGSGKVRNVGKEVRGGKVLRLHTVFGVLTQSEDFVSSLHSIYSSTSG